VGLYRGGDVNKVTLKQTVGKPNTWGYGTASEAVAFDEKQLYVLNTKGRLLIYTWTPDQIDSCTNTAAVEIGPGIALAVQGDKLLVGRPDGTIEERLKSDPTQVRRSFKLDAVKKIATDSADRVWVLSGNEIAAFGWDGARVSGPIPALGSPTSLSLTPKGTLLICDDGPRQQVLELDIAAAQPALIRSYGQESGMAAGTPEKPAADKFFALRGAGLDRDGNLYVALSHSETVIRSLTPDGNLRWQVEAYPFTCIYDFDRLSDGRVLYGIDEIMETEEAGGTSPLAWKLTALTISAKSKSDPRLDPHSGARGSAFLRRVGDRRVLFTQGMYANPSSGRQPTGCQLYVFDKPEDLVSRSVGVMTGKGWAWNVDSDASIWEDAAEGGIILRHRLEGFSDTGEPRFTSDEKDRFARPASLGSIDRIQYDKERDWMALSGYTKGLPLKMWGLTGSKLEIFSGWSSPNPRAAVSISLPVDDKGLYPKAWAMEDDFVFVAACMET